VGARQVTKNNLVSIVQRTGSASSVSKTTCGDHREGRVKSRVEAVMIFTKSSQVPQCLTCASTSVYVECLEPSPRFPDLDECRCRCGQCGTRFEALASRDAWFIPCLLGDVSHIGNNDGEMLGPDRKRIGDLVSDAQQLHV
jgi:hypothetical protein